MKAYKGFNKNMECRGFKYEEGKDYETSEAVVCHSGFHACEYPLDCFNYYEPNESVYREVEVDGDIQKANDDSKVSATKIHIGAKIDIAGMVKAAIEFTMSKVKPEAKANEDYGASSATGFKGASSATGFKGASSATGSCGASSATGSCGASSATGFKGASSATGDYGASSATGSCGASSATGFKGASSATGFKGASSATGFKGASSATGDYGASSATGDYGASSATGSCGASSATGFKASSEAGDPESIAVAWGYKSRAKGVKGSYIVLTEWEYLGDDEDNINYWTPDLWRLKTAKMVHIDGKKYKADTFYQLVGGKVVE